MSKVNYRKSHITDFLGRMEGQALEAVRKECNDMYNATFHEILNRIPYLEDLISAVDYQIETLNETLARTRETIKDHLKSKYSYDRIHWEEFNGYDLLSKIRCSMTDKEGTLENLLKYKESRENEVRATYKQVKSTINSMSSPEKMRKYLDDLGFDTSLIDTLAGVVVADTTEIDKRNLFPYKELMAPKE
jgi:ribosomal protein S8